MLTYCKAFEPAQPSLSDHSVIATLKKEFQQLMDKSFFESSLKAHHWLATFLDPLYKHFEFLPTTSHKEISFKSRLLSDVEKWSLQHMEKVARTILADQSPGHWKNAHDIKVRRTHFLTFATALQKIMLHHLTAGTKNFYIRCVLC